MVNQGSSAKARILLLGGSSEASLLARALARTEVPAVFSYAGRVKTLTPQPLPTRVGGFGGVEGLIAYLRSEGITHVIDATHPFASRMSEHAARACEATRTHHVALVRPPWTPEPADHWDSVPDMDAAVEALGSTPQRVFLAIGRQHVGVFRDRPDHFYLLRFVEAPEDPVGLPLHAVVVARGPFVVQSEIELMQRHRIEVVVCKNAGGSAARAKLDAARELGLRVVMIRRPPAVDGVHVGTVQEGLAWLAHSGVDLGE
ncbi:MAG: cobalt-precorrin-6A reductase [Myxococcota bacterium]